MTFIPNWEEFEKSAEMLYLQDPINTRYCVKYSHAKGLFIVKITDNKKVIYLDAVILLVFLATTLLGPFCVGFFSETIFFPQKCLQYKTEIQQDVRKIDQFISNLIRHMASNDN